MVSDCGNVLHPSSLPPLSSLFACERVTFEPVQRVKERRGGRGREEEEGWRRGEERGGGGGEGAKVPSRFFSFFYFSLFNVTCSEARNCSPMYPPLSSPFPSLTPLRHPSSTPPSLRVGGPGGSRTKKKSKAVDKFVWVPARLPMGKSKGRERGQEVEGKRMRAESADDQDQKVLRRFEELIERVGPEKFRRLADQVYSARTTGMHDRTHGESSKHDRTHDRAQRARVARTIARASTPARTALVDFSAQLSFRAKSG
jgi:hypothetical protein